LTASAGQVEEAAKTEQIDRIEATLAELDQLVSRLVVPQG